MDKLSNFWPLGPPPPVPEPPLPWPNNGLAQSAVQATANQANRLTSFAWNSEKIIPGRASGRRGAKSEANMNEVPSEAITAMRIEARTANS
jgi:hypothetical protein